MERGSSSIKNFLEQAVEGRKLLIRDGIFLGSSVASIAVDPLLLYIPIINDHQKCIGLDKKMMIVALFFRSVVDLFYVIHIIFQICAVWEAESTNTTTQFASYENKLKKINTMEPTINFVSGKTWERAQKVLVFCKRFRVIDISIDVLAVLPIPQVIVICFMAKIRSFKYSWNTCNARAFINIILFLQYGPRASRIIILFQRLKWHVSNRLLNAWGKGLLSLFCYLTSCHIAGAFYYIFSIQRVTSCWYKACKSHAGCILSSFECDYNTSKDLNFVNEICPLNPPDEFELFDFGIFLNAIQSGTLGAVDFPTKFVHSFWWGLRHLSSFGQNLDPSSTDILEVGFIAALSIFGLVLFIYLIGNVQTYMQMEATKTEEIRRKMIVKEGEVELWLLRRGASLDIKPTIMQTILFNFKHNKDVDVDNLFHIMSPQHKKSIKNRICFSMVKQVPVLQNMKDEVIEDIINNLEPVMYDANSYIVREGEPLDLMIFIIQGVIWSFKFDEENVDSNHLVSTKRLEKGDFYGEELLMWAVLRFTSAFGVPISTTNVKTHKKVEAFVLMYDDLKTIVSKYGPVFSNEDLFRRISPDVQEMAASVIQQTWRNHRLHNQTTSSIRTLCKASDHQVVPLKGSLHIPEKSSNLSGKQKRKTWKSYFISKALANYKAFSSSKWFCLVEIIIDILAILPVPQVIILVFVSKMSSSKYSWDTINTRTVVNIILFLQYVPRGIRIIVLIGRLKWHVGNRLLTAWVQGLLNFFLYMTASHIAGAFWYVLSIQRVTSCWYHACLKQGGCILKHFECDNDHKHITNAPKDHSFLNEFCPINPPNTTVYNFGIFLGAIKSGTIAPIDIPSKFMLCLRWGLRHLSSFGQNLEPNGIFEMGFVSSICILGVFLFTYLIGNVQTLLSLESAKTEEIRLKMQTKEQEVNLWMHRNDLSMDTKTTFMQIIQHRLKKNKEVNVDNLFHILSSKHKRSIKRHLSLESLKRVSMLENMEDMVLDAIIEHLEPMSYAENSYIIREGEPLDFMLFITHGTAWTFTTKSSGSKITTNMPNSVRAKCLKKGDFYGEELIEWATLRFTSIFGVPISKANVKTHNKVQALALMYEDLRIVVRNFGKDFSKQEQLNRTSRKVRQMAASVMQAAWRHHHRRLQSASAASASHSNK